MEMIYHEDGNHYKLIQGKKYPVTIQGSLVRHTDCTVSWIKAHQKEFNIPELTFQLLEWITIIQSALRKGELVRHVGSMVTLDLVGIIDLRPANVLYEGTLPCSLKQICMLAGSPEPGG